MTHPNLFDVAASVEARDNGIGLVEAHKGAQVERILGAIGLLARAMPFFSCDDLHAFITARGITEPAAYNAFGAAVNKAKKMGLIEDSGQWVTLTTKPAPFTKSGLSTT